MTNLIEEKPEDVAGNSLQTQGNASIVGLKEDFQLFHKTSMVFHLTFGECDSPSLHT